MFPARAPTLTTHARADRLWFRRMLDQVGLGPAACYAAAMDRFAEMIGLMDELYGKLETWPIPPRQSQAGIISTARAKLYQDVKRALRSGELVREACETCGEIAVEAHHADYSKPLEVRWLCRSCHRRYHAVEAKAAFLASLAKS